MQELYAKIDLQGCGVFPGNVNPPPVLSPAPPPLALLALLLWIDFAQGDLCHGIKVVYCRIKFVHKCLHCFIYYCSINSNTSYRVDDKVGKQAYSPGPLAIQLLKN